MQIKEDYKLNMTRKFTMTERVRSVVTMLCVLPFFVIMATGVIVTSLCGFRKTLGWWFARTFCAGVLRMTGCNASVGGLEHVPVEGGFVLAANHQSHYDGLFLISFIPRLLQAAAKRELYYILPLGLAFWAIGFVPVHRHDPKRAADSVSTGVKVLRSGGCMLVFPEGTRTDGVRVHSFKTGAARMAIQGGVPILPVGIAGTEGVMAAKSWFVRPGVIRFEVGEPISSQNYVFDERRALSDQAHSAVHGLKALAASKI